MSTDTYLVIEPLQTFYFPFALPVRIPRIQIPAASSYSLPVSVGREPPRAAVCGLAMICDAKGRPPQWLQDGVEYVRQVPIAYSSQLPGVPSNDSQPKTELESNQGSGPKGISIHTQPISLGHARKETKGSGRSGLAFPIICLTSPYINMFLGWNQARGVAP